MRRTNLRIAIQKSGRLREESRKFLEACGVGIKQQDDSVFVVPCADDIEILFVRYGDIPQYVETGAADFGIVGQNILYEKNTKARAIKDLDFGFCRLVIAVPNKSGIKTIKDLEGERIATSYPNSLRKFLRKNNCSAAIINIQGAVEAAPAIGLADAVCDITQTGSTLKANGLRLIGEIIESQAVLIESPVLTKRAIKFKENIDECL
jgi:ATP phosphoribosyltransferase